MRSARRAGTVCSPVSVFTATPPAVGPTTAAADPGVSCARGEEGQRFVVELQLLADARHPRRARRGAGERQRAPRVHPMLGPGDRVAVRARRRITEQGDELLLDVGGDGVLPPIGLPVHLLPLEPDHVGEQALGQPVAPDDRHGEVAPLVGELAACGRRAVRRSPGRRGGSRSRRPPGPRCRDARPAGPGWAGCPPPRSRGSSRDTPRWHRASRPSPEGYGRGRLRPSQLCVGTPHRENRHQLALAQGECHMLLALGS